MILLCSTFVYVKFLMVWAAVLMADFILEFRFEYLWPFWLLIRSVYDSFKYQGLVRISSFVSPLRGGLLDPGLSVRLSTFSYTFYSALDLPYYWEESNETLHSKRVYIVVVHLGIGFIEQRKMCL